MTLSLCLHPKIFKHFTFETTLKCRRNATKHTVIFQVSWIRATDAHILTVDHEVFISDPRFSAIHQKNSSTWTLQIKWVQGHKGPKQTILNVTKEIEIFCLFLNWAPHRASEKTIRFPWEWVFALSNLGKMLTYFSRIYSFFSVRV